MRSIAVSVSVCLSVCFFLIFVYRLGYLKNIRPNLTKFSARGNCGSVLLRLKCDMLGISRFLDDVKFSCDAGTKTES